MLYARAADLVVVTHVAFIAFALLGGYATWRWPRLVWVHLPAVAVIGSLFVIGADCPLTDLEKYLRRQAGEAVYRDGFVAHYLLPGVPDGLRSVGLPVFVALVTAGAYVGYVAGRRRLGQRMREREGVGPTVSAPAASSPSGGRYSATGVRAHHAPVSRRSSRLVNR
jgi:hypothetical protein